ncbi:MAG TPA: UDP-N-acetylglucosamine 2-epimerase (non-hydrolyzing) [Candidatus Polarisedimenticolia bacterium]|nr:UDP-N-acetylglucosamine 2-epimerase (non-hydrolyzing) [Candidatus Polarisedimenticolia bacterium]
MAEKPGDGRPVVLVILGTRPEAIKLFPVARALQAEPRLRTRVVTTGQHREMVDQILQPMGIVPDRDLDIMRPDQSLNDIVSRIVPRLEALYDEERPALVLVQGDTTSAFCAGLTAFHRRIAVGHVEAGLRSFNRFHPYPEEANRRMLSSVTDLHLAATPWSADNLVREGVPRKEITVTGNTVIDALLETLGRTDLLEAQRLPALPRKDGERIVLITLHRRENWMQPPTAAPAGSPAQAAQESPLEETLLAIADAAAAFPQVKFVYPVHRNPRVQEPARRLLSGRPNVHLLDPQPYIPFVDLLARAALILTDSGGIQEEAPSLGVPVLVARETTERPEGVEAGTNVLVGTRRETVLAAMTKHLSREPFPRGPLPRPNPFGDGRASGRIRQAVLHHLGLAEKAPEFAPPVASSSLSSTRA